VVGSYDDSPEHPAFLSQFRNLLHCFTHHTARRDAATFWGACGAMRSEVFYEHGGFDQRYSRPSIEDVELGLRVSSAGGRIEFDPTIQGKHLKQWTLAGMLRTDIVDRGIPWTRLILRSGSIENDLNTRTSQRISVALVGLMLVLAALEHLAGAAACVLLVIALNAHFLSFLYSRRGLTFALAAIPLMVLFFLSCGIAFVCGLLAHVSTLWRPAATREQDARG
jgi:hypothetical protein